MSVVTRTLWIIAGALFLSGCVEPVKHEQLICWQAKSSQYLPPQAESFTLLNWNIYKLADDPDWQQGFVELVSRYQVDLLSLQEVNLTEPSEFWPEQFNLQYGPNIKLASGQYSGVMNGASWPLWHAKAQLSPVFEPISTTPKVFVVSTYKLDSYRYLRVFNIHAINFVDDNSYKQQLQQLAKELASQLQPTLLVGDFNSWSESRFELLKQMTEVAGLSQLSFSNDEAIKRFLGDKLDHVFYSKALQPSSAMVLDNSWGSDHNPMLASFTLSATPQVQMETAPKLNCKNRI